VSVDQLPPDSQVAMAGQFTPPADDGAGLGTCAGGAAGALAGSAGTAGRGGRGRGGGAGQLGRRHLGPARQL